VIDKLGFLVRFWELNARHASLGIPLSAPEQVELLSLMQLVAGDLAIPSPGPCARPLNPVPAQLIGEGTILSVEIRHVSAAALLVASVKPMTTGERAIVRTADPIAGVEYALPCSLAWACDAAPWIMALVVDGVPNRSELTGPSRPPGGGDPSDARALRLLSRALSIGRQARLVT
jgi:hypothetical protein